MSRLPLPRTRVSLHAPSQTTRVSCSGNGDLTKRSPRPVLSPPKYSPRDMPHCPDPQESVLRRLPPLVGISDIEREWRGYIGRMVQVTNGPSGVLRFFGPTQFSEGLFCGIELDRPLGKNDGSYNGVRYFTCPPQQGIFAPTHKVTLLVDSNSTPKVEEDSGESRGSENETFSIASYLLKRHPSQIDLSPDLSASFSFDSLCREGEVSDCASPCVVPPAGLNVTYVHSPVELCGSSGVTSTPIPVVQDPVCQQDNSDSRSSPEMLLDDMTPDFPADVTKSAMLDSFTELDDYFTSGFFREIEARVISECLTDLQGPAGGDSRDLEADNTHSEQRPDSDFASGTASPASSSDVGHCGRFAQVIDGKLYYSGDHHEDRSVTQLHDPQVISGMDSSGIFSDFDPNRPESCVCSGVYTELQSLDPKPRSGINLSKQDDEVDTTPCDMEELTEDGPSNSSPDVKQSTPEHLEDRTPVKKVSPRNKFKIPEKFVMPRRNVESKIKAMLTPKTQESTEVRVKAKSAKKGRWDDVMNKIAQNKHEHKVKPRQEVKSKVFAQISLNPLPKSAKGASPRDCSSRCSTRSGTRPPMSRRRGSDKRSDQSHMMSRHTSDSSLSHRPDSGRAGDLKSWSCTPNQLLGCPSVVGSDVSSVFTSESNLSAAAIAEKEPGKLNETLHPRKIAKLSISTKHPEITTSRGPGSSDAARMRTKPPMSKVDPASKRKLQDIRSSIDTGRSKLKSPRPLKSEVARLEALCETRTKELQQLKLEIKNVLFTFDVILVLYRHACERTDTLFAARKEAGKIKRNEIQSLTNLLEEKERQLVALQISWDEKCKENRCTRERLSETEENLRKTKEVYSKRSREVNEVLQERTNALQDVMTKSEKRLEDAEIALQLHKDRSMGERQQLHELILAKDKELEAERGQQGRLKVEIVELLSQNDHYQRLYESTKNSLREIESNLEKDSDCRVQVLAERLGHAQKEIDSLRKVVDMKALDVRRLAVEKESLTQQLVILNVTQEKLKLQKQRTEDVQELLARETDLKAEHNRTIQHYNKIMQQKDVLINNLKQENDLLRYKSMEYSNDTSKESEVTEFFSLEVISPGNTSPSRRLKRSTSLRGRGSREVTSPPKMLGESGGLSPPRSPKSPVVKGVYARENSVAWTLELAPETEGEQLGVEYSLVAAGNPADFANSLLSENSSTPLKAGADVDMVSSITSTSSLEEPSVSISSSELVNLQKVDVISAHKFSRSDIQTMPGSPRTEGAGESLSRLHD